MGEGQVPFQWDRETLGYSSMPHYAMTDDVSVCVCACVCLRACAYAWHCGSTRYELLPQMCLCLLPARIWGDGCIWQVWGAEQSGQPFFGTLFVPSFSQCPCPTAQRDGGKVEGERLTSQLSHLLFCGSVLVYVCVFERVYSLDGDSETKHALWIM